MYFQEVIFFMNEPLISCPILSLDSPVYAKAEILTKKFVGFLVDLKTQKHFEIN